MEYVNVIQDFWEKKALVRRKPRLKIDPKATGYFYPPARQPLCLHPIVSSCGEDQLHFLLVQSLYKYTHDIAVIETRVVTQILMQVIQNTIPIHLNSEQKTHLYTIMVDEMYHAYVAYDAMQQVEQMTQIVPLSFPEFIEIELALASIKQHLSDSDYQVFQFIAVCLAENTLTKEMVSFLDSGDVHPFCLELITDHLSDEGRHAGIFVTLLGQVWLSISKDTKQAIATILPLFLKQYLGVSTQKKFDSQILAAMKLTSFEIEEILQDTYLGYEVGPHHPMLKNIYATLARAGMMDSVITPALQRYFF